MPSSVVRCRYPCGTVQLARIVTADGPLAVQALALWERVQRMKMLPVTERSLAERKGHNEALA